MTAVVKLDEARPNLTAGARPLAIVPQTMDEAYRLAKAICMAGMAPRGLDKPEQCMVAIMHGLEIGLTPMTALQRIAVVNGRPTLWGDGAMSLVRGSGVCEWIKERIEGAGDAQVAVCEAKRRGEPDPIRRTFSIADAKKAGLWGKQGPWTQFPARMLQMRARAFALRDGFADVLGGLYLREEIEDNGRAPAPAARISPPAPPEPLAIESAAVVATEDAGTEPTTVKPAPASPPDPDAAPPTPPAAFDIEKFHREMTALMANAETIDQLENIWNYQIEPMTGEMFPPDVEALMGEYRKHERRLAP
jgi:hypothetical protein